MVNYNRLLPNIYVSLLFCIYRSIAQLCLVCPGRTWVYISVTFSEHKRSFWTKSIGLGIPEIAARFSFPLSFNLIAISRNFDVGLEIKTCNKYSSRHIEKYE